jgi:hypothetical protein
MRLIVTGLLILLALLIATPTIAGESGIGRYQAILIGGKEGSSSCVFILDTKEGHIWTWGLAVVSIEKVSERITYKGRVRPGKKVGEVIEEIITPSIEEKKKP